MYFWHLPLYRELRKPLLRYLVCLGLSLDEAQDVVQDAFLGLHRHLTSGGAQDNIRSWVFRVAHNQARNRQQSYHRRFSAPLDPETHSGVDHATPERALSDPEITLVYATRSVLETIATGESATQLFRRARSERDVPIIEPRMIETESGWVVTR